MARIVLADDHPLVRDGLRRVIDAEPDMRVVGEAADGGATIAEVAALRPDVLLLDVSMPGGGGISALDQIRRASAATRILVLTMHEDPAYLRVALASGASGFLVKRAVGRELVAAIRSVLRGQTYVDPALVDAAPPEALVAAQPLAASVDSFGASRATVSAGMPAAGWTGLLAAAVAHDINNLTHGLLGASALGGAGTSDAGEAAAVFDGCLKDMRRLGARLRALAAAGDAQASGLVDDACADALAEVDPIRGQVLRAEPIPTGLRARGTAAALRTATACLLEHAAAASPAATTIALTVRQGHANGAADSSSVVVEIAAREASGRGEIRGARLDALLDTSLRDLRGDLSLVVAGAIADELGGAVYVSSSARDGLLLTLRLVAAPPET